MSGLIKGFEEISVLKNQFIRSDHTELIAGNPLDVGICINKALQLAQFRKVCFRFRGQHIQFGLSCPDPGHLIFLSEDHGNSRCKRQNNQKAK